MNRKQKKQSITSGMVIALLMVMRFIMRRVRPSALIRSRSLETKSQLDQVGLDDEVLADLPRNCFHANGKPMEAMNLILVGPEEAVVHTFLKADWHEADPVTPWSLSRAFWTIVFNRQYLTGPMTPLFVDNKIQTMSFQKPTPINKFKERHHSRIWSTTFADSSGKKLWIAHGSFDISIKAEGIFRFPPTHAIAPDIDTERDFMVDELTAAGAKLRGYIELQSEHQGINAFGDLYQTDGRAAVLEVKS